MLARGDLGVYCDPSPTASIDNMGKRIPARACLFLLGTLCALGCGQRVSVRPTGGASSPLDQEVILFAAASTGSALDEISARLREEFGITIRANYAASSTLAQQIENGAGADVFVSANEEWADYLEQGGLVRQRHDLMSNRLVVIVPARPSGGHGSAPPNRRSIRLHTAQDLLADKVVHLALADPGSAPAGIYARQALTSLGLWQQLKTKVVAAADVRQALSFVETGAAEAGIVYATDAAISQDVEVALRLDPDLTDPITYPIVLLDEGADNPAAQSLYQYLVSPKAAEVFQRHGFLMLTSPSVAHEHARPNGRIPDVP